MCHGLSLINIVMGHGQCQYGFDTNILITVFIKMLHHKLERQYLTYWLLSVIGPTLFRPENFMNILLFKRNIKVHDTMSQNKKKYTMLRRHVSHHKIVVRQEAVE